MDFDFTTILEAKKAKNWQLLNESSLSRIWSHYQRATEDQAGKSGFAMLSAFKAGRTRKENMAKHRALKATLRAFGLGYIEVDGVWTPVGDDTESDLPQKERSLFIIGITPEQSAKLMAAYDQDAVVIGNNSKVTLVFQSGDHINLGPFMPNTLSQAYSKIKGKGFHFEWVTQTHTEVLMSTLFG
ncbi:DUF3293 domain-containing protein [Patescibacteria group bacterium]|nr:MAG: DUF3293 domain-containing protein [Patescibacteria group bacterium]